MAGQHHILASFGTTGEISQMRFGFRNRDIHCYSPVPNMDQSMVQFKQGDSSYRPSARNLRPVTTVWMTNSTSSTDAMPKAKMSKPVKADAPK